MATANPDELSSLSTMIAWLKDNSSVIFGGGLLAAIVRGTMQVSDYTNIQRDHATKIALHDVHLEKLDVRVLSTELKVAELPTKDDLRDMGEAIRGEVRSGFGQLSTMLKTSK